MCEQCLVNPIEYGEVLPGWFLIRATKDGMLMNAGEFGLVQTNSPAFTFSQVPEVEDASISDGHELLWFAKAGVFESELMKDASFDEVCLLGKACYDAGYTTDSGFMYMWLFNHLGEIINKMERDNAIEE